MTFHAYCWRSGLIGFGASVPEGALPVYDGHSPRAVRQKIEAVARHGHDGSLLVPGVPEAGSDDDAACAALVAFRHWIHQPGRGAA